MGLIERLIKTKLTEKFGFFTDYSLEPVLLKITEPSMSFDINGDDLFLMVGKKVGLPITTRVKLESESNTMSFSKMDFESWEFFTYQFFDNYLEVKTSGFEPTEWQNYQLEFFRIVPGGIKTTNTE